MKRDSKGLTVGTGLLILLMCIMLSATAFVSNFLPYRFEKEFTKSFTVHTNATVYEVGEIETDGTIYYGPTVEFWYAEKSRLIHAKSASTFKSSKEYKVGDTVEISYDPNCPGDLTINNSEEQHQHFRNMTIMAFSVTGLGLLFFILGLINTIKRGRADTELLTQKFIKTPDGKRYEEWAEEQRKLESGQNGEALPEKGEEEKDSDDEQDS